MTKPPPRNLQRVGLPARGLYELLDHRDPPLDLGLVELECLGEIDHALGYGRVQIQDVCGELLISPESAIRHTQGRHHARSKQSECGTRS
jgi:hypothetical protein